MIKLDEVKEIKTGDVLFSFYNGQEKDYDIISVVNEVKGRSLVHIKNYAIRRKHNLLKVFPEVLKIDIHLDKATTLDMLEQSSETFALKTILNRAKRETNVFWSAWDNYLFNEEEAKAFKKLLLVLSLEEDN